MYPVIDTAAVCSLTPLVGPHFVPVLGPVTGGLSSSPANSPA